MSNWAGLATVLGSVGMVLGTWLTTRATRAAARVTAAAQEAAAREQAGPAAQQAGLEVLRATVTRVDQENADLRARMSRMEALVRAFSLTVDDLYRWARHPVGDPPPPHPLVEEYNRTGG